MTKNLYGILFALSACAVAAGTYFLVIRSQSGYPEKLIFSGVLLLLALIVGIYASSKTKDAKARAVVKGLDCSRSCGIAVYYDGEFAFANRRYLEIEQKENVNLFKAVNDSKSLDGYDVSSETHKDGKNEYTVIFITEKPSPAPAEEQQEASAEKADEEPAE